MTVHNKNFYYETSAINYMVANYSWNDAVATQAFQYTKGNIFYISPIGLWEIFLTRDYHEREKIIFFCQHLFHHKLVKAPSEFIVNYIRAGCPNVETPYNIHTDLEIGKVWEGICVDKRKTISFDQKAILERTKFIRNLYKKLDSIISRITLDITVKDDIFYQQEIIGYFFNSLEKEYGPFNKPHSKIIKLSILFVMYILCCELELDPSAYNKFWTDVGVGQSVDRLFYLYNNHRNIFMSGPFYLMALMAHHQISNKQKSNRGLILDCLHTVYITYFDYFLTNDNHFKEFSNKYVNINSIKIWHMNDVNFTYHTVDIRLPDS